MYTIITYEPFIMSGVFYNINYGQQMTTNEEYLLFAPASLTHTEE